MAVTRTFSDIFVDIDTMNEYREQVMPSCPEINEEEYAVLTGRYADSHIRYRNEGQFLCAFFSICLESIPKCRAKLKANQLIRGLNESEIYEGERTNRKETEVNKSLINQATNPDTEPATDTTEPLPYINGQEHATGETVNESENSTTLGRVSGLYYWKHSLGSQAYNEFLDAFRPLFRQILSVKEVYLYGD